MAQFIGTLQLEHTESGIVSLCFQSNLSRARSVSVSRRMALKRKREESVARSASRARSSSRPPRDQSGVRDPGVSADLYVVPRGRQGRDFLSLFVDTKKIKLILVLVAFPVAEGTTYALATVSVDKLSLPF